MSPEDIAALDQMSLGLEETGVAGEDYGADDLPPRKPEEPLLN